MFTNGNRMSEMLMKVKGNCPKCGTVFQFGQGVDLARQSGIADNVVMCPHCHSIYIIELSPRGMTFVTDATAKYPLDQYPKIKTAGHKMDISVEYLLNKFLSLDSTSKNENLGLMIFLIVGGAFSIFIGIASIARNMVDWTTILCLLSGIFLLATAYFIKRILFPRKKQKE